MALKSLVQSIYLDKLTVAYRAPARYAVAAHTIFTITGGPVWIRGLFGRCTEAVAAGSTFAVTICGVAMQNAAVAIAGAINTIIMWPLGAAGTQVIIPALLCQPMPTLATEIIGQHGQLASVGNIVLTVAVALTDGNIEFYCVYYRMNPASNIA